MSVRNTVAQHVADRLTTALRDGSGFYATFATVLRNTLHEVGTQHRATGVAGLVASFSEIRISEGTPFRGGSHSEKKGNAMLQHVADVALGVRR